MTTPVQSIANLDWKNPDVEMPPGETPVLIVIFGEIKIGNRVWENPSFEDTFTAFQFWDCPYDDGQGWEDHYVTAWAHLPEIPAWAIPEKAPAEPEPFPVIDVSNMDFR